MIKYVYDERTSEYLYECEATPNDCQKYCDRYGQCLSCYGEFDCTFGNVHLWTEYTEQENYNEPEMTQSECAMRFEDRYSGQTKRKQI